MGILNIFKRKNSVSNNIENVVKSQNTIEMTKEEFRHRKKVIDEWLDDHIAISKLKSDAKTDENNEIIRIKNIYCPKCEHTDATVNKFVKKGVSVFKYNHCNHCGNEWEHTDALEYNEDQNQYASLSVIPNMLDHIVCRLWHITFDPTDITCEFDSAEEMEQCSIDYIKERYGYILEKWPLEVIYHVAYRKASVHCLETEYIFGKEIHYSFNREFEKYAGKFTEKMEDILVNKLGVKKLF